MLWINFFKKFLKPHVNREKLPYVFLEEPPIYGRPDEKEIKRLKNKFRGERCFVVGNGPSLNKIDLECLKDEYTFGVNGIFYKTDEVGFRPTFYVVEDKAVIADNLERINQVDSPYKFFPTHYKSVLEKNQNTYFFRMNVGYYRKESPNFAVPRFSTDFSKRVYCGQSVTMLNLQIAYYLGFETVYLVGMDFSYSIPSSAKVSGLEILSTEADENHFHPDYFGPGKTWHDPQLDRVLNSYKLMKLIYECDGRSIYNATVGGELELFERKKYAELF